MTTLLITSNLRQRRAEGDAKIRHALTERKDDVTLLVVGRRSTHALPTELNLQSPPPAGTAWFSNRMLDRDPSYVAEPAPSRMV